MKTLVVFLLLSLSFIPSLFSQNFGLIGTEWYYSESAGGSCPGNCEYVHFESVLDTVIEGKTTHKITRTYYKYGGDTVYLTPLYVYSQLDTTFRYSFSKSRFLSLFIFNGNQGDTLTLDYPPSYLGIQFPSADTTYRLVVDSVINRSIDGVPLKEYRTTSIDGLQFYNNDGSFMDRIGGLDWIFPRAVIIPEAGGPIRCYSDVQVDTSFQSVACDFVLPTSISENLDNSSIKLYPNPSSNHLIIERLGQSISNVLIEIRSVKGKLAFEQKVVGFEKATINTAQIPAGVYVVVVKAKTKIIATQKWVKVE